VLLGAWGARAGELLRGAGLRAEHREGALATADPPHATHDGWLCWLYGEPQARGELAVSACAPSASQTAAQATAQTAPRAPAQLTGALAQALATRGERAWESLFGRFAAIAYERASGRCWVVRDQLGAQPLVWTRTEGGVLFAEHECELLDALPRTPTPDRLALLGWIENGMPPAGRTLYEGIERVPAGGRLALGEGAGDGEGTASGKGLAAGKSLAAGEGAARTATAARVAIERWWRPRYAGVEPAAPAELGGRVRDATFAAVDRAAAGAKRAAVKLSGGLDSATVAAGLAAGGFARAGALALGGTFAAYAEADERELIEATARATGLALELIAYDARRAMLEPALAHIERWRVPPGTPNLFLWQPLVARARELGVDALLDGEGGDELFGVAAYLIADRLRGGRLAAAWSLSGRIPGMGADPDGRVRLRVLRHYGVRPLVPAAIRDRRSARAARRAPADALIAPADRTSLAELRATGEERLEGPRWWRMQVERMIGMREALDMGGHFRREAVDAGIAIGHPLLHDLPLIETALRVPPEAQFDALRDRALLRDALRDRIPEAVRTRHAKSHFTQLVLDGLEREEAGLIEPLRRADAPLRAYVRPAALDRRLAVAPRDRQPRGAGLLWRMAIANRWLLALGGRGGAAGAGGGGGA
jgi:asparagine synthase (glutamine-hydrolysing)